MVGGQGRSGGRAAPGGAGHSSLGRGREGRARAPEREERRGVGDGAQELREECSLEGRKEKGKKNEEK